MRLRTLRHGVFIALAAVAITAMPATAGAATKSLNPDGSIPAKWNITPPIIPGTDTIPPKRVPVAGVALSSGAGNGRNNIQFENFDDGDILSGFPGTTFTGHTGIWKDSLYSTAYSYCVWSANVTPVKKVQKERAIRFRDYDYCYGDWVPSKASFGKAAVDWCAAQEGEPYDIASSKSDYGRWYCSKLVWAGWKVKAGVDLDADGGYWVKPADIVNDSQTTSFAFSN